MIDYDNIEIAPDVPTGFEDPELYVQIVTAAFQGLLSNPELIRQIQKQQDDLPDNPPWGCQISDMAIDVSCALIRRISK